MKKLLASSLSVIALAVLGTGCLKDKKYEGQQYGTQVNDSRAVAFPESRSANSITYGVVSSSTPQDLQGPYITLEAPGAQSTATNITLQINDALVTADPALTILPPSSYVLNLNRVIPAGATYDSIMFTLPNSGNLDPNLIYAIGLTIVSADNGFAVASNMKNIILKFTVKNKYDGVYAITGTFLDVSPAGANFTGRYPLEYRLVTTGPSSVDVQLLVNGSWVPAYLFSNNGAGSFYGSYGLTMSFDANDDISDLHNYYGDPTKAVTPVGNPSLGTGAPNYAASNGRMARLDPTGVNNWSNSTGTPIITIKHQMWHPSVVPVGPRVFLDEVWTYTGPRP